MQYICSAVLVQIEYTTLCGVCFSDIGGGYADSVTVSLSCAPVMTVTVYSRKRIPAFPTHGNSAHIYIL